MTANKVKDLEELRAPKVQPAPRFVLKDSDGFDVAATPLRCANIHVKKVWVAKHATIGVAFQNNFRIKRTPSSQRHGLKHFAIARYGNGAVTSLWCDHTAMFRRAGLRRAVRLRRWEVLPQFSGKHRLCRFARCRR